MPTTTKTISVSLPHRLTQEEARARIQGGIADARRQFGGQLTSIDEHWTGNQLHFTFTVMGQALTGRVDVQPSMVHIELDLPWLLAALAEKVRGQVLQQGTKLLEKK